MKDSTGRFLTKALFIEFGSSRFTPMFTLQDQDDPTTGAKSLRRLYMEAEDPTEGKFAEQVFGSFQHWQKLCSLQWFQPYIRAWREDLEAYIQGKAFEQMKGHAAKSPQAAKWLAEKGWKNESKRGRPSNDEVEGERKRRAEEKDFLGRAASRVFEED